jgi:hypothetical protein
MSLQEEIRQSIDECLATLQAHPANLKALWASHLFWGMSTKPAPALVAGHERYLTLQRDRGADTLRRQLVGLGVVDFLSELWRGAVHRHQDDRALSVIVDELLAVCDEPSTLAKLAAAPSTVTAHWGQVGPNTADGCERLARRALALAPNNTNALYLYAQEDFREAVNASRAPADHVHAAPVAEQPSHQVVVEVRQLLSSFAAGKHPLALFVQMEVVPVEHEAVVEALIAGLSCAEYRGAKASAQALGRATAGRELAARALCERLRAGADVLIQNRGVVRQTPDTALWEQTQVAKAAAEALGQLAPEGAIALEVFLDIFEGIERFDRWERRELEASLITLAPNARAESRPRVRAVLEVLASDADDSRQARTIRSLIKNLGADKERA